MEGGASGMFRDILRKHSNFDLGGGHTLYVVPTPDVISMVTKSLIVNWRFNRPFDRMRVSEIQGRMSVTKYVSDTIKLAQIGNSNELVIYDGVHRLLGLNADIPCVVLDVMFNVSEEKVIEEFVNVNKSVPVPDLYIANTSVINDDTRRKIEEYVSMLVNSYPCMCSPARNCHKPRFNSDVLKNDIYEIYNELGELDLNIIYKGLESLNNLYINEYMPQIPDNVASRCIEGGGLFLFCEGRTINRDKLRIAMMINR